MGNNGTEVLNQPFCHASSQLLGLADAEHYLPKAANFYA